MMAHSHLQWDLTPSAGVQVHMQIEHSYIKFKQILRTIKKEKPAGAREMAHWLRALAALAEARV